MHNVLGQNNVTYTYTYRTDAVYRPRCGYHGDRSITRPDCHNLPRNGRIPTSWRNSPRTTRHLIWRYKWINSRTRPVGHYSMFWLEHVPCEHFVNSESYQFPSDSHIWVPGYDDGVVVVVVQPLPLDRLLLFHPHYLLLGLLYPRDFLP